MPSLQNHQSATTTKMLLIGDSGGGKTGALASLAGAGFNLRILDVDNGLDVLNNLLNDPKSPYPKDSAERVKFETVTDKMKKSGTGVLAPEKATVWPRTIGLLTNWVDSGTGEVLGPISSWGSQDILVIDSLTMLSDAALNFILGMNGRLGQRAQLQDWGAAQDLVEGLLQMLYDDGVKCNVIVCAHVTYIGGEDGGAQRGYPNTLGKKLPPKVGRYFNSMLAVKSSGQGTNLKRKILTNTTGAIDLKNTAPLRVLPEYPLESGLADYFKAVRS